MPRVSIIIPAYNAAGFLAETLDSVVAQTYDDWEAIVVDDASTDGTDALASSRHPQIACIRAECNLGTGGARNRALERSTGELIVLLDHDDLLLPRYLEKQVAHHDLARARGRNVGIVCCYALELGPEGLRARTYSERAGWEDEVTLTTLLRRNTIFARAMAPRAVVEEVGGFSTDCLGVEDYDLWLRILESGRSVIATREPLAIYRVSEQAISTNVLVMARAAQTAYRHALARGNLSWHQRRIARRELRLHNLVEQWETITQNRTDTGRISLGHVAHCTPLAARVLLERPERWLRWLRIAVAIARGAPAAGVDRSRLAT